jgi:hypothetical protein
MEAVMARRLYDIFPPGFDSTSVSRGHYNFASEQLYRRLTHEYHPEKHIDSTIVKSVWYGKQKKAAEHEFLLIKVEDTIANLSNYIVLDRNLDEKAALTPADCGEAIGVSVGGKGLPNPSRSCRGVALDAFRVSYDGIEKRLLQECLLTPREYLEKIDFSIEEPLYLYQLVTLANVVSTKGPYYAVVSKNCYWFAGLIWECLRHLHPNAVHDGRLSNKRGKITALRVRYIPEERHRDEACEAFKQDMALVEERLSKSRKVCCLNIAKINK